MDFKSIYYVSKGSYGIVESINPPFTPQKTIPLSRDEDIRGFISGIDQSVVIIDDVFNEEILINGLKEKCVTISLSEIDHKNVQPTISWKNNMWLTYPQYYDKLSIECWLNLCRSMELFKIAQTEFEAYHFKKAEALIQKYSDLVDYESWNSFDNRSNEIPKISVVVVAYNTREELLKCLNSLFNQTTDIPFEVIIVDNGNNESVWKEMHDMKLLHIQCPMNIILSEGRNIGVHFAKGEYIAFLDDDALVPVDYIQSVGDAFNNPSIKGIRGKVLEKTDHKNNSIQGHYDLGDVFYPHKCNTEGNSAFRKIEYIEVGGMNPLLFGEEGSDLSARICEKHGLKSIVYWPDTIIFHDYANTDSKKDIKLERHLRMEQYTKECLPHVKRYTTKLWWYTLPFRVLKKIGLIGAKRC